MKRIFTTLLLLIPFVLSAQVKIVLNDGDTVSVSNYERGEDYYTIVRTDGSSSKLPRNMVKTILRDYTGATEVYCLIVGQAKFLSTEVTVFIDYGQERSFWKFDKLEDEKGNVRIFNSMIDALNYMNSKGWEFVDAYSIATGQQNVYHWLLKRDY
jgi:hypothetical protein